MYKTMPYLLRTAARVFSFFVLLTMPLQIQAKSTGNIVVTIKPLYSLVAQLSDGITKPTLLIKQLPSAHHYNMRPSDRRLLANASMIVWIGPQMESYLSKVISQQDAIIVSAMQADGLQLLNRRIKNDTAHSTADTHNSDHAHSSHLDPHIWLSSRNAIAISKHIAKQLIINDPENTSRYEKNLQQLINKINALTNKINKELKDYQQAFISYHDAFQYFENEHNLHFIDAINFDEEAGTSIKHLRHIKMQIEKNNIQCLVYQAPQPDIVKTLTATLKIRAVALDPLGQHVQNNEQAWLKIMQNIADSFKHCLSDKTI